MRRGAIARDPSNRTANPHRGAHTRVATQTHVWENVMIIRGTAKPDTLNGTSDDDTIYGYGADDQLFGNDGDDHLFGALESLAADFGAWSQRVSSAVRE